VIAHGGPSDQERAAFNPTAQFLATNGYAVLAVNYRGSTGYGRDYARRLDGRWGELDVADCAAGARFLGATGRADPNRLAILGASAGGFTALQSVCASDTPFAAAVVLYGVSDPLELAGKLPKFESRYLDRLIGPLPAATAVYRARTPLARVEDIRVPMAVFHGEADEVITPAQTTRLVDAVRANGVPCEFHLYSGEGHGWRRAETVAHFHRALAEFLAAHCL
jgi:dipeptidyl aminopeptidase/acylaminoacyl peptidase